MIKLARLKKDEFKNKMKKDYYDWEAFEDIYSVSFNIDPFSNRIIFFYKLVQHFFFSLSFFIFLSLYKKISKDMINNKSVSSNNCVESLFIQKCSDVITRC